MPYKVICAYHQDENGWTEIFYANPAAVLPNGYRLSLRRRFAPARIALLNPRAYLDSITIHDMSLRQSGVVENVFGSTPGTYNTSTRDVVGTAAILTLSDQFNTYRRHLWLRGLPDDAVAFDGDRISPGLGLLPKLEALRAAMVNSDFVIRAFVKSNQGPYLPKPIVDVYPDTLKGRITINCPAHGLAPGTLIRIRRCAFRTSVAPSRAINRTHIVLPSSSILDPFNNFDINVNPAGLSAGDYRGNGQVLLRGVGYFPIQSMYLKSLGTRSTGRPRHLTRGRRTAKRGYQEKLL